MKENSFIRHILNEVASSNIYQLNEEVDELTAWHSGPKDFDKFDGRHVNSGCGSQFYGWGIYVATDENIADGYKKTFDNNQWVEGTANVGGVQYEVEIPDDNGTNYIDWDGPEIKELPDVNGLSPDIAYQLSRDTHTIQGTFGFQYRAAEREYRNKTHKSKGADRAVSMYLAKCGYTGIKAAGYRNSGGYGKPNYVIFVPARDIKIVKKNHLGKELKFDKNGLALVDNQNKTQSVVRKTGENVERLITLPYVSMFDHIEPNIVRILGKGPFDKYMGNLIIDGEPLAKDNKNFSDWFFTIGDGFKTYYCEDALELIREAGNKYYVNYMRRDRSFFFPLDDPTKWIDANACEYLYPDGNILCSFSNGNREKYEMWHNEYVENSVYNIYDITQHKFIFDHNITGKEIDEYQKTKYPEIKDF